jgi:hypothetical protein
MAVVSMPEQICSLCVQHSIYSLTSNSEHARKERYNGISLCLCSQYTLILDRNPPPKGGINDDLGRFSSAFVGAGAVALGEEGSRAA